MEIRKCRAAPPYAAFRATNAEDVSRADAIDNIVEAITPDTLSVSPGRMTGIYKNPGQIGWFALEHIMNINRQHSPQKEVSLPAKNKIP